MIKRPFFSLSKPILDVGKLTGKLPEVQRLDAVDQIRLYLPATLARDGVSLLTVGQKVKTGQKLSLTDESDAYVTASVTGTIVALGPYTGDFGQTYTQISIDVADEEVFDEEFAALAAEPDLEKAQAFLACVPGNPPLAALADKDRPIDTIVVLGLDQDLLVATIQHTLQADIAAVKRGIAVLKKISAIDNVLLVASRDTLQGYGHLGAEAKAVAPEYPAGLPQNIMKDVLGQTLPAGKTPEDLGVLFISAEAVAAIGNGFSDGRVPVTKLVTVIDKGQNSITCAVAIGTPVAAVLTAARITVNDGDRIIFGGPMRGGSIYSLDAAIMPDTDAIMIQDKNDIPYVSDYPCINCGDCIRACPAKMQVHMLVRLLEVGQYQEAADQYDLYSCIECGLCSYVCVAKIPVFQYIRLAKHELARLNSVEATNAT
jgi:Na+-translocating ferredoxin:NAD+ oxidoreductase subunit C